MVSFPPQNRFGSQFKDTKGLDIAIGDIDSLFTYPYYWKSFLVPHLLIGKIDHPAKLAQGWTCHQAGFFIQTWEEAQMKITVYFC